MECTLEPEPTQGMTGVSLSANVLRELKEEGRTNLRSQTKVAGMVSGAGKTQPKTTNETLEDWAINHRVELVRIRR